MKIIKTKLLIIFVAVFSFAFANNSPILTDLPAQIKAFVNQNRAFINKTKTIPNCQNLYNVFATIERDVNTGLSADDISTRFNQALQRDNPSGEALKHYITAYNLLTQTFKTDKVDFVNPSPQKPTEKETPPLTKLPWQKDYQISEEKWNKMDLEKQKGWLMTLDIDAEEAIRKQLEIIKKENEEMRNKIKNQ